MSATAEDTEASPRAALYDLEEDIDDDSAMLNTTAGGNGGGNGNSVNNNNNNTAGNKTPERTTQTTITKKRRTPVSKSDAVLTIVRVRPLQTGVPHACVRLDDERTAIRVLTDDESAGTAPLDSQHVFKFDMVCDPDTTQAEIFALTGRPIVDECLQGYNGTIFAYGQTGSGKTYSVQGSLKAGSTHRGLIPRTLTYLFDQIARLQQNDKRRRFTVALSMLQIYNDQLSDLLVDDKGVDKDRSNSDSAASGDGKPLRVREHAKDKSIFVDGLTSRTVATSREALALTLRGVRRRATDATQMNEFSSRSHCFLSLTVESTLQGFTTRSRLHLVDLAGSEDQRWGGNDAKQFGEAVHINLSLTYLGQLLRDVAAEKEFCNYRNCNLTHLLRDSLGGNAKTCVIANVSPEPLFRHETLSTLRFAAHLRFVRNRATRNATGYVMLHRL
jgi:kinesin family protein 15